MGWRIGTLAVAVALAAATASAEDKEPLKDAPADWLKRPTPENLLAVWPREAMRKGVDGRTVISCKVSEQGALFACEVISEKPEGMGFGQAAIALTPQLLMKPAIKDGKPVVTGVRLPINFVGLSNSGSAAHIPGGIGAFSKTVITDVPWIDAPAYSQVAAVYPKKAAAESLGGRATIACVLKDDGGLHGCSTVVEEPKGKGFANAAKRLAPLFKAPTRFSDGSSAVGAQAHIAFVFTPEMLDPARRVIGKAQWAQMPSGDAFAAGYPKAAKDAGVRLGRVVIGCMAGAGGKLEGCKVVSEEPTGLGFGAAALALSPSFYIRPWTAEGLPTIGGEIRVPIRYVLPEEPPPAKP
jgi:TonB family protein